MYMKHAVAVAIALLLGVGMCHAQNVSTSGEAHFRLEWEVGPVRGRGLMITGYIYNQRDLKARDVQLLVEELDSAGRPVSERIGYVDGNVPPGGRAYFEVPAPRAGKTYRLGVHAVDWVVKP